MTGNRNMYQEYIDKITAYYLDPQCPTVIAELYVKDLVSKVKCDASLEMLQSILENMKDGTGNNS